MIPAIGSRHGFCNGGGYGTQNGTMLFTVLGMVDIYTLVCRMLRKFPLALRFCILGMTFAFGLPTLRYSQWGLASLHRGTDVFVRQFGSWGFSLDWHACLDWQTARLDWPARCGEDPVTCTPRSPLTLG